MPVYELDGKGTERETARERALREAGEEMARHLEALTDKTFGVPDYEGADDALANWRKVAGPST